MGPCYQALHHGSNCLRYRDNSVDRALMLTHNILVPLEKQGALSQISISSPTV